jgi:multidrug efflux pump
MVIVGGMSLGTVLTLFVVPTFYTLLTGRKTFGGAAAARAKAEAEGGSAAAAGAAGHAAGAPIAADRSSTAAGS